MLRVHLLINGIASEQDLTLITNLSCYRRLMLTSYNLNFKSDSVVVSSVSAKSCHTSPFTLGIPVYLIQCLQVFQVAFPDQAISCSGFPRYTAPSP